MITQESFHEWRSHPVTIEVYKALEDTKKLDEENLINGNTLCTDPGETSLLTARIVGKIQGLNQLLNISYEDEGDEE